MKQVIHVLSIAVDHLTIAETHSNLIAQMWWTQMSVRQLLMCLWPEAQIMNVRALRGKNALSIMGTSKYQEA